MQFMANVMAPDDKDFFTELGKRIAQLRKEQSWSQQQLAQMLGIAQQTLGHYEMARLRVPASMLPQFAQIFKVGVDDLIGTPLPPQTRTKRGPASQLQQHMERVSQLPKPKQKFIMEMLETVLAQANA
jgi:transcriptional regulator with XRE-family HTH domain